MSCSSVNGRRDHFNEKILLRKQRRQGVDVEANIAQKFVDLQLKTKGVVEELVPRLHNSTNEIDSFIEKVVQAVKLTEPEKMEILQATQKKFKEILQKELEDLASEKRAKEELLNKLSTFRKKLEDAPVFAFNSTLHEAGNRISHLASTGKQMPGPEQRMGPMKARVEQILNQLKM